MSERTNQKTEKEQAGEPSALQARLNWRVAWRDDARVAQALYEGQEIEEIHDLSEAGLLDEFLRYLEQVGMMAVLEQLQLPEVQRVLVPTVQFVLLYLRHPCWSEVSR
jgi:hypothetical protein